jgi:hypothetical protein
MYNSRIILSVGGSVWYTVWNLRCTVTIDLVLTNSKPQNASLFPVHAMFRHDCLLAVKPTSTPRRLVRKKKLGEIFYILICSFLLSSCLLRGRVRNFRRDLWITLYNFYSKHNGDASPKIISLVLPFTWNLLNTRLDVSLWPSIGNQHSWTFTRLPYSEYFVTGSKWRHSFRSDWLEVWCLNRNNVYKIFIQCVR